MKPSGCKIGDRETFKLLSWKTDTEFTDPKKVFDAKLDRSDGEQVLVLNEQEIETGLDKTILDHLKSKLLVLEVSNPLYKIRNLKQRLEGNAKPAAIGFQLPIIETMEDRLYAMLSESGGMDIPMNKPSGWSQNKRYGKRDGKKAADFPESMIVQEPQHKNAQ